MTDPLQRKLKIGKATVGLIGLDQAMNKAIAQKMTTDEAVAYIYDAVAKMNYIPDAAVELYQEALRKEYERMCSGTERGLQQLTIRILGPGCISCNKLNTMIFDIMQRLDIAADIEQIHDQDEIWRHGVLSTPALIINGEKKCAGRMPSPAEVERWLQDAMG